MQVVSTSSRRVVVGDEQRTATTCVCPRLRRASACPHWRRDQAVLKTQLLRRGAPSARITMDLTISSHGPARRGAVQHNDRHPSLVCTIRNPSGLQLATGLSRHRGLHRCRRRKRRAARQWRPSPLPSTSVASPALDCQRRMPLPRTAECAYQQRRDGQRVLTKKLRKRGGAAEVN